MLSPTSGPTHQPRTVSDTELGIATLVLLVAIVLTAILVPALA